MDVKVSGKDIDLGEALQVHVTDRLDERIHKYFGRPIDGTVTFSREGADLRCDCVAHLSSGIVLSSQGVAPDAYGAFDIALEHLEKRIRRYKRRLKNHHNGSKPPLPAETASAYILAPFKGDDEREAEPSEADAEPNPVIVAESSEKLREMTVGTAVMQLDLTDKPVLVFRNAAHGGVNVVYRRPDGNVGWIDPSSQKAD